MNTLINIPLKFWLALLWSPKMSWRVLSHLLNQGATVESLFNETKSALLSLGLPEPIIHYLLAPNWQAVDQHLEWATQPSHSIICMADPTYPLLLREAHDPPLVLFVHGDESVLNAPQLAVVGSRKPTRNGIDIARSFSEQLAKSGVVITSGLAHGIDTASHQGALAGKGRTIAVMGTGIDQIYPKRNQKLAEQIIDQGALVTEFVLGSPPLAGHFPQRNRIVTGLSLGTLVVEATLKSGTLISARLAMEQNREVFAIPGSIHNPLSAGCHYLIKNGAKLTASIQDIEEEIPQFDTCRIECPIDNKPHLGLDVDHKALLECIDFEGTDLDTIISRLNSNLSETSPKLLNLQLEGLICTVPGGYARVAI